MNRRVSEIEKNIRKAGLVELRNHLLSVVLGNFKKILLHKEKGFPIYQIFTGNVFWDIGELEWKDVVDNEGISLLLSHSLTEILGGQRIRVDKFRREVYRDMDGNKRTVEGMIEIDLST